MEEPRRKIDPIKDARELIKAVRHERLRLEEWLNRSKRRKPPEAGLAVPVAPPKGPLPMQGGAEAALDFED